MPILLQNGSSLNSLNYDAIQNDPIVKVILLSFRIMIHGSWILYFGSWMILDLIDKSSHFNLTRRTIGNF